MWIFLDGYGVDKELSWEELALCETQGALFESVSDGLYDPEWFVNTYLKWERVKDIDKNLSGFRYFGDLQILDVMKKEFSMKHNSSQLASESAMYWIGYITRYWNCWLGTLSSEIVAKVPFEKLYNYYPLHTLGNEEALHRILMDERLLVNEDYLIKKET